MKKSENQKNTLGKNNVIERIGSNSFPKYPLYWQEKDQRPPPTCPGIGPSKSAEIRAEHFFSILFRVRNHAAEIFHNFLFQKTTT